MNGTYIRKEPSGLRSQSVHGNQWFPLTFLLYNFLEKIMSGKKNEESARHIEMLNMMFESFLKL